jgi:hypothetical protein
MAPEKPEAMLYYSYSTSLGDDLAKFFDAPNYQAKGLLGITND